MQGGIFCKIIMQQRWSMADKMNDELLSEFNRQINKEFQAGYLYYAMSTYFDSIMMHSFSMYMKHKASFELNLAQKMYNYLILRNKKLLFLKIDKPNTYWSDISDIFNHLIMQEEKLLKEIKNIYHLARKYNDEGAIDFFKDLIDEKNEILNNLKTIFKIKKPFCNTYKSNNFDIAVFEACKHSVHV
jgi:ferritin